MSSHPRPATANGLRDLERPSRPAPPRGADEPRPHSNLAPQVDRYSLGPTRSWKPSISREYAGWTPVPRPMMDYRERFVPVNSHISAIHLILSMLVLAARRSFLSQIGREVPMGQTTLRNSAAFALTTVLACSLIQVSTMPAADANDVRYKH